MVSVSGTVIVITYGHLDPQGTIAHATADDKKSCMTSYTRTSHDIAIPAWTHWRRDRNSESIQAGLEVQDQEPADHPKHKDPTNYPF